MSVIQTIRDRGAVVMVIVLAITLIAFILMDGSSGARSGMFSGGGANIGSVNGTDINRKDFNAKLEAYRQQGQPESQLNSQIWDQEVNTILLNEEFEKLGINFTEKELAAYLTSANPPQWLQQLVMSQNNGQFDPTKVGEIINNIKGLKGEQLEQVKAAYLDPTFMEGKQKKYLALLQNSVNVPKWYAQKRFEEMGAIASAQYVSVPYTSIADSTIKVTDDDVKAYISKYPGEFVQKESMRRFGYVSFDVKATANDSMATMNDVAMKKQEFATTTNNQSFIDKYGSAIPYQNTYLPKDKVGGGMFKDSILKMPAGTVYGPYADGGAYVLAKHVGTKVWADSVKVRHILIATQERNPQTGQMSIVRRDEDAKKVADSLAAAIKAGSGFDSLCARFSEDPGSKDKGGVYDNVPVGQMVPEFNNFIFDQPVGGKGVVKTDFGYHYIEVLSKKGSQTVYNVAFYSKPIDASEETRGAANALATKFHSETKNAASFKENANKYQPGGMRESQDVKRSETNIPGIGESSELVNWLYKNDIGDISQPITIGDKYVVAIVSNVQEKGKMNVTTARPIATPFIINQKKAKQIIETKFKGKTLEEFAQSTGTAIVTVDSLGYVNGYVPNLGQEPKFVGIAFNKSMTGKTTEPIAGTVAVYAVKPVSTGTKPVTDTDATKIKADMEQQLKQGAYNVFNVLKQIANIKDYRFEN